MSSDRLAFYLSNAFTDKWKVIVGVTVPVISILLISVLVMIYQQIQRQRKLDSETHQSLNHEENISYAGNAMDMEVSVHNNLLSVYIACIKYRVNHRSL